MDTKNNYCIFGLSKSWGLAKQIAEYTKFDFYEMQTHHFRDGEILLKPQQSVRGKNVILVQSTSNPTNDSLMELLIAIDAVKHASAKSIWVLIPYFGYSRQDRKSSPREPITSRLVTRMIEAAGATRVLTVDIHSHPTVGYFNIPVDNVSLIGLFCDKISDIWLKDYPNKGVTLVSPDYGGVVRVRQAARILEATGARVAIIDKRRPKPNASEALNVLGDVKDQVCFIIDDIIDTGGTICKSAEMLHKKGAIDTYVLASHGVLSGQACANLEAAVNKGDIKQVIITNTVEQSSKKSSMPGLKIINTAKILADFLIRLSKDMSIGAFYQEYTNVITRKIASINKKDV